MTRALKLEGRHHEGREEGVSVAALTTVYRRGFLTSLFTPGRHRIRFDTPLPHQTAPRGQHAAAQHALV